MRYNYCGDILYLYDESGIVGAVQTYNTTTETFYFDRNIKGDVIGIYNASGTQIAKYSYDAWGKCTPKTLVSNSFSTYNPIRYRGYYYDRETTLYYLNARYYDPSWRRFISPDHVSSLNPSAANGLNLYSYANNNPICMVYSNSNNVGKSSFITLGVSFTVSELKNINYNYIWLDLSFLSSSFSFIENSFSMIAGFIDGYRKINHLSKLSGLEKATNYLMAIGITLNGLLSIYDNFVVPNDLSISEKCGNVIGDASYILVSGGIVYGIGYITTYIPYVGPFISPVLSLLTGIILDQIWRGEDILWIDDLNISIDGKSLEVYFKNLLSEWIERKI